MKKRIAEKLGYPGEAIESLFVACPVGGWLGTSVADEIRAKYNIPEDEMLGEALVDRGILTTEEGRWLDDEDEL